MVVLQALLQMTALYTLERSSEIRKTCLLQELEMAAAER